ncbi:MAG TPA: hypothetical protein VGS19_37300 [Streptosporangiaceae bacterium]|nr:hypothetical protein [Streptosporangiaceae bacterium]
MEPTQHTDPLEEALSQGSQRVAQVASLAAAMAQVVMQHRALESAKRTVHGDRNTTRALSDQQRLLHQQARLTWAPAHDRQWLAQADLVQVARAWAGAAAYADTDPTAVSAMHKCEDRLRRLHPYAMARYDRLRNDDLNPLDAMRETAPLFAYSPTAHVGDPAPERQALAPGTGQQPTPTADDHPANTTQPQPDEDNNAQAETRGKQIVDRLQSSARSSGRPELGADELALVLEATTNLPSDAIEHLTRRPATEAHNRTGQSHAPGSKRAPITNLDTALGPTTTSTIDKPTPSLAAASTEADITDTAAAPLGTDHSAAQLAAQSFPYSATATVQSVAMRQPKRTTPSVNVHDTAKRPGRTA